MGESGLQAASLLTRTEKNKSCRNSETDTKSLWPEKTARVALLAAISKARMIATAATYLCFKWIYANCSQFQIENVEVAKAQTFRTWSKWAVAEWEWSGLSQQKLKKNVQASVKQNKNNCEVSQKEPAGFLASLYVWQGRVNFTR